MGHADPPHPAAHRAGEPAFGPAAEHRHAWGVGGTDPAAREAGEPVIGRAAEHRHAWGVRIFRTQPRARPGSRRSVRPRNIGTRGACGPSAPSRPPRGTTTRDRVNRVRGSDGRGTRTRFTRPALFGYSAHLDPGARHGVPDHRVTGYLPHHQQPAGSLGVGQDQQVVLDDIAPVLQVRAHPVQVAAGAAGHEAVPQRSTTRVQDGHRTPVDHRPHPGRPAHLEQVAQQPEAGDVGGRPCTGRQGGFRRVPVELGHRGDRLGEHLAGLLVPVVQQSQADRLGQRDRQPRSGGVVAQQTVRVGHSRHRHAVLGLRVVDGVPTDHRAGRLGPHLHPATQHLGQQLHRQDAARPADQVDGDDRPSAHRVHVRQRVGRGDPAPVVGVVDDGGEEVRGGDDCQVSPISRANPDHGRVVPALQADQHVPASLADQPADRVLQFPRRDLAGAAAAVRVSGQPGPVDLGV